MKAVLLKEPNKAVVEEIPVPQLDKGDILVEMKACGLCGTDIEKMHGQYTAARPVLGHEAAGVISEVGADVDDFKVGDRVFPHHHTPCYSCHFCKHGSETMCNSFRTSNLDPCGFAEYFRVPAFNIQQGGVLKLPESVGFEAASLIEPVSCCIRGLNRCGVSKGDSVLVVGAGPMGLMHLQLLKQLGAQVLISEVNPVRIAYAREMGAHQVYDAAKMDVPSTVRKDTEGRGVDVALVAAGSPKTIVQALKSVRKGGTVCLFGVPVVGSVLDYDFSNIFNAEVSIVSSYGSTERETNEALRMIEENLIDSASLITNRFRLEDFGKAVETAMKGNSLKIVITP
ncbi:MAG: zinc-dependent dehydrogenase [Thaumarchaeota archaeon]|nr:zinc-dependent dehydrogenase [Nitrososphaerota archaeon]